MSHTGQSSLSAALCSASVSDVARTSFFLTIAPPGRVNLLIRYSFMVARLARVSEQTQAPNASSRQSLNVRDGTWLLGLCACSADGLNSYVPDIFGKALSYKLAYVRPVIKRGKARHGRRSAKEANSERGG
jgi:hypothetical protein